MKRILVYAFILALPVTGKAVIIQNNLPFAITAIYKTGTRYTINPGQEQKILGTPTGLFTTFATEPISSLLFELPIKSQITFYYLVGGLFPEDKVFYSSNINEHENIRTILDKASLLSRMSGTADGIARLALQSSSSLTKNLTFDSLLNSYLKSLNEAITALKSL